MASSKIIVRLTAALKAFREALLTSDVVGVNLRDEFSDFEARRLRYAIYWSFYENNAYRDLHVWSQQLRTDNSLYQYIRNIYNPAYRLGEFWKTHLWGGILDPEAGDGSVKTTALPVLVPSSNQGTNERIRAALSKLWEWSNWSTKKDLATLYGAVFGDLGLMVVDDTDTGKVYLEAINPATIQDVTLDSRGNVKGYILSEFRDHPEKDLRSRVTYTEIAERADGGIHYKTLLDGQPYAWNEKAAEWDVREYDFIPLVMVHHHEVGLTWGWSEFHPLRHKIQELDDLTSKTHDHIRKSVDPAWLFAGVSKPTADRAIIPRTTATEDRPMPGREELKAIYAANPQARPWPLVADLDLEAVVAEIKNMLDEIERDYPELQVDISMAIQTNSGRAVRLARQPAEVKVIERRGRYDNALIRAQQMAMTIGGIRNYEDFRGITADTYKQGALDHSIGNRPVFARDPIDELEIEEAFWVTAKAAADAGLLLPVYLKRHGWTDKEIKEATPEPEEAQEEETPPDEAEAGGEDGRVRDEAMGREREPVG